MALGLIPALRAGVFTIGSEGQFGIGALDAGIATLGGRAAPARVARDRRRRRWRAPRAASRGPLIPALLRAYLGIDEILTTFAFNFIATFRLLWLLTGPRAARASTSSQTSPTPDGHVAADALGDSVANVGLLLLPGADPPRGGLRAHAERVPRPPPRQRADARPRRARAARAGSSSRRCSSPARPRVSRAGCRSPASTAPCSRASSAAGATSRWRSSRSGRAKVHADRGRRASSSPRLQNGSEAMQLGLGVSSDFVFVMQGLVLFLMSFHLGRRGQRPMSVVDELGVVFSAGVLASGIRLAVPTALAAIGEAISQRAGIFNLGLEGMMMVGAFTGFAVTSSQRTAAAVGTRGRRAGGAALAVADGARARRRGTNVIVTGFSLVLLGQGLAQLPLRPEPGRACRRSSRSASSTSARSREHPASSAACSSTRTRSSR